MKAAILSESVADQAAVHILVSALVGHPFDLHDGSYEPHGWSNVFRILPSVLKALHYTTDVDALAVVMDSDKTPPHMTSHDALKNGHPGCRLCGLRNVVKTVQAKQTPIPGRPAVKVAIGLAVPCIEAWLRCGHDSRVTEAAWAVALQEKRFPYDCRQLKRDVYGTDIPSRGIETQRMIEEATRLAQNIDQLQPWFPGGFGPFAASVRSWLS